MRRSTLLGLESSSSSSAPNPGTAAAAAAAAFHELLPNGSRHHATRDSRPPLLGAPSLPPRRPRKLQMNYMQNIMWSMKIGMVYLWHPFFHVKFPYNIVPCLITIMIKKTVSSSTLATNTNGNCFSAATTYHILHMCYYIRLRTEAFMATEFENLGIHPPSKPEEEKTEGQIMNMGGLANLICGAKGAELPHFSFNQILAATGNLSEQNFVGQGGFGNVYMGKLSDGLDIAVKRHDASSFQGSDGFRTEVEAIPNLQHKNIITLLGYCAEGEEKILIYEYMPKCLSSIIADETKRVLLNWSKRLQIIKGIADGLAYLQAHSQMCIVHRDIKPSNILLDDEMSAKIADFGFALMLAPNTTAEVPVMGTYGYADPEYVGTGIISEKADVYSFGIVLLEIISRRRPIPEKADGTPELHLSYYARTYQKKLRKLVDPLLCVKEHENTHIMEWVKVALLCTRHRSTHQPTMSEVVTMLGRINVLSRHYRSSACW